LLVTSCTTVSVEPCDEQSHVTQTQSPSTITLEAWATRWGPHSAEKRCQAVANTFHKNTVLSHIMMERGVARVKIICNQVPGARVSTIWFKGDHALSLSIECTSASLAGQNCGHNDTSGIVDPNGGLCKNQNEVLIAKLREKLSSYQHSRHMGGGQRMCRVTKVDGVKTAGAVGVGLLSAFVVKELLGKRNRDHSSGRDNRMTHPRDSWRGQPPATAKIIW